MGVSMDVERYRGPAGNSEDGAGWGVLGIVALIAGAGLLGVALAMHNTAPYGDYVNFDAMATRVVFAIAGIGLLITGAVLASARAIISALAPPPRIAASPTPLAAADGEPVSKAVSDAASSAPAAPPRRKGFRLIEP